MASRIRKPAQPASAPGPGRRRARNGLGASRTHSARHLLSGGQLRQSLVVAAPPSLKIANIAGAQAGLSLLIALATAHLSPWPDLVGFPALGALAALFGRYASLRHRRRIVMICGFLLVAGVFAPSLAPAIWAPPAAA